MFCQLPLRRNAYGNGYVAESFTWLPADQGGDTWQKREGAVFSGSAAPDAFVPVLVAPMSISGNAATTSQFSVTVCDTLTPPNSSPPPGNRALNETSTP